VHNHTGLDTPNIPPIAIKHTRTQIIASAMDQI